MSRGILVGFLGVGPELAAKLNEAVKIALQIEARQIAQGMAELDMARNAAIAAPFIPVVWAAAPLAGGMFSPTVAVIVAKSAVAMTAVGYWRRRRAG